MFLFVRFNHCCIIVQSIDDKVEGGNITVYRFPYPESFDISLISEYVRYHKYLHNYTVCNYQVIINIIVIRVPTTIASTY